jgi:hypothetical protein
LVWLASALGVALSLVIIAVIATATILVQHALK